MTVTVTVKQKLMVLILLFVISLFCVDGGQERYVSRRIFQIISWKGRIMLGNSLYVSMAHVIIFGRIGAGLHLLWNLSFKVE